MTRRILALLCCPSCRGDLELRESAGDAERVERGALVCRTCGRLYAIERGVPRFVQSDGYLGSFSFEWTRWSRVQMDGPDVGRESEETFTLKTGFSPEDLRGQFVLDVGCGAGRFLDVASRWGAHAVGVDASYAVDAAAHNVGHRADVVQADIFALPFKYASFDVVYSLGVLHHTKDTRGAFLSVVPLLRDGGHIAVWLYYYPDRLYRAASDFWRRWLTPLPPAMVLAWSWLLCALFSGLYRRPVMQRRPWSLLARLLPVATHPKWSWRVLDTFDWYSPRYQDKECAPLRVLDWCREGAVRSVVFLPFPTSIRGVRDERRRRLLVEGMPDLSRTRCVVFGAGAGGRAVLAHLRSIGVSDRVVAICDNDPAKIGAWVEGHLVCRYDALPRDSYDYVFVGSATGDRTIAAQLTRAGLVEGQTFASLRYLEEHAPALRLAAQA